MHTVNTSMGPCTVQYTYTNYVMHVQMQTFTHPVLSDSCQNRVERRVTCIQTHTGTDTVNPSDNHTD